MMRVSKAHPPARVAIMQWTAQLLAAERDALLASCRPLAGQPALYTITRAGLRASGLRGLDRCRVTPANARHAIVCASVAAVLERCYPEYRVLGERELRRDERECDAPLASARLGRRPDGGPLLHRPDLVLWPNSAQALVSGKTSELSVQAHARPVAVEVELTVKAPRRLFEICRAWARCRCVAGVLYLAASETARPLARAIEKAQAGEQIVVVSLDALPPAGEGASSTVRTIPSNA
jgi:hypothetical protein